VPEDIIIIAIDEESLRQLGAWPWRRDLHTRLLDRLAAARPRATLYDVLFITPDAQDANLARSMAAAAPVYLPILYRVPGRDGRGYDVLPPQPVIAASANPGHADIHPDSDGVVRRIDLALDGQTRWLHIVAKALDTGHDLSAFSPSARLHRRDAVLVNFGGPPGHVRTVPFVSVLDGSVPVEFLRDKYVLVGAMAAGLGDQYSTPMAGNDGVMAGVEIQANLLDTLLHGRVIKQASVWATGLLAIGSVWILLWAMLRLRPSRAAVSGVLLILATAALSYVLMRVGDIWLPPATAFAAMVVALPLWAWRRLEVVNSFMRAELEAFANEPELFVHAADVALGSDDPTARQMAMLGGTIARVRSLQQLVSTALQSLPDPTLLIDSHATVVAANAAARRMFGDEIGADAIDASFIAEPSYPGFADGLQDPAMPLVGERRAPDGSIYDIRQEIWRDADGSPLGWIVRFSDITALRLAETRREEALQLLTHDMRSPQASILAVLAQNEAAIARDVGARIGHYAERTIALADGFLRLAQADAGDYPRTPVDIADILCEAADDLWPQARAAGVEVLLHGAETEILINGNRALLTRAVANIIGNAIKYSARQSRIKCALLKTAGRVQLGISDTGRGMNATALARLFGRFSQNVQHDSDAPSGVGLGLAFVDSVIKGHGGTIACQSIEGQGTTFLIDLPECGETI
jgi:CHASE2 domain-containing sensor protein/signal transduction histidine kinase